MHKYHMNSNTQTRELVQLGLARSYPEARKRAAGRGMELAPYLLVDKHVVQGRGFNLVSKELLAHPEANGVFQNGRDINDSTTKLSIPAAEVPKDAFGRTGIGMLVVPKNGDEGLEPSKGRIWVHPSSILIFTGMIQTPNTWMPGKPHETLGIPVAISPEEFARLPEDEKRLFFRIEGEGVRHLVRGDCDILWGRNGEHLVDAYVGTDVVFVVAGVAATAGGAEKSAAPTERQPQLELMREGGRLIVEGLNSLMPRKGG